MIIICFSPTYFRSSWFTCTRALYWSYCISKLGSLEEWRSRTVTLRPTSKYQLDRMAAYRSHHVPRPLPTGEKAPLYKVDDSFTLKRRLYLCCFGWFNWQK